MGGIKRQTFLNFLISYLSFFISFFNTFFRTQVISAEQIGVISIILSISWLVQFSVLFGTPNIILKFLPASEKTERSGIIIFLVSLVSVFFLISVLALSLFKGAILNKYGNNDLLSRYYSFIFLYVFSGVFFRLMEVNLQVNFKSVIPGFIQEILLRFGHLIILVVVLLLRLQFHLYILLYFFLQFSKVLVVLFYFINNGDWRKPTFQFLKAGGYKTLFSYSIFIFFSGFASIVTTQIDKLMIGAYLPLAQVGIYTIAVTFANTISIIGTAMSKITHPKISHDYANGDMDTIAEDYKSVGELQFMLSIFMFVAILFFGKGILNFFGNEYGSAYLVALIIASSHVVNLSTSICGGIIVYSRHYRFDFYSRLFLMAANVMMNFFLIPALGIEGAAIATAFSLIVYNILKVVFVRHKFKIQPFTLQYAKVFLIAVILSCMLLVYQYLAEINGIVEIIFLGFLSLILFYLGLLLLKFQNHYFISLHKRITGSIWLRK